MKNERNPNRSLEKLPVLDALSNLINFPKPVALALIVALTGAIGALDFATGNEISLSLLYLAPVIWASWQFGLLYGITASVVSTGFIFVDDSVVSRHLYTSGWIPYWNAALHLGFFLVVVIVLEELNKAYSRECNLARRDYTTGIANNNAFYERARLEIDRARRYRHPLTVAFIDFDNFKQVNDTLGHEAGNELLRVAAQTMLTAIRRDDCVARVGGDEFALIFPETGPRRAREVAEKLQRALLNEMSQRGWPVTFSIGLASHDTPPDSVDALLRRADANMYAAKRNGKNRICEDEDAELAVPGAAH